jgi:hypothetical protein
MLRAARRRRAAFAATAQRLRRRCVFTGTLIAIPDVAQLAEQAESVRLPGVPEGTLTYHRVPWSTLEYPGVPWCARG